MNKIYKVKKMPQVTWWHVLNLPKVIPKGSFGQFIDCWNIGYGNDGVCTSTSKQTTNSNKTKDKARTSVVAIITKPQAIISTIGGGDHNQAKGNYSAVSGGQFITAKGTYSAVGGGTVNQVLGKYFTVGGGFTNRSHRQLLYRRWWQWQHSRKRILYRRWWPWQQKPKAGTLPSQGVGITKLQVITSTVGRWE